MGSQKGVNDLEVINVFYGDKKEVVKKDQYLWVDDSEEFKVSYHLSGSYDSVSILVD